MLMGDLSSIIPTSSNTVTKSRPCGWVCDRLDFDALYLRIAHVGDEGNVLKLHQVVTLKRYRENRLSTPPLCPQMTEGFGPIALFDRLLLVCPERSRHVNVYILKIIYMS